MAADLTLPWRIYRERWGCGTLQKLLLSLTKSCLTLCNPMDCSTQLSPVICYLPEFAQIHVFLELLVIPSALPSSVLDTFWPAGLIVRCPIFLPFHTVHGVLAARILGWGAISSREPRLVELFTLTHLSGVALHSTAHSFIELQKPLCHNEAVIHEGDTVESRPHLGQVRVPAPIKFCLQSGQAVQVSSQEKPDVSIFVWDLIISNRWHLIKIFTKYLQSHNSVAKPNWFHSLKWQSLRHIPAMRCMFSFFLPFSLWWYFSMSFLLLPKKDEFPSSS